MPTLWPPHGIKQNGQENFSTTAFGYVDDKLSEEITRRAKRF